MIIPNGLKNIDNKLSDIPPISPTKRNEKEVKKETGIKTLTLNHLLTRLYLLLEKTNTGNNSNKLKKKKKIKQVLYLMHQHNKILRNFYKNLTKFS